MRDLHEISQKLFGDIFHKQLNNLILHFESGLKVTSTYFKLSLNFWWLTFFAHYFAKDLYHFFTTENISQGLLTERQFCCSLARNAFSIIGSGLGQLVVPSNCRATALVLGTIVTVSPTWMGLTRSTWKLTIWTLTLLQPMMLSVLKMLLAKR